MERPAKPMPRFGNLADQPIPDAPGENFETLLLSGGVRVVGIASHHHADPPGRWYRQAEAEFVLLVSGEARLGFPDGPERVLRPGDWAILPAGCPHRVAATDAATRWLALHLPP